MKIAIAAFVALAGSLALLNVFSDHQDKHKGAAFGMPGQPGATHFTLKGPEHSSLDKAQIAAIDAELPIINKRTSLSGEGQFVRPIIKVHGIVME